MQLTPLAARRNRSPGQALVTYSFRLFATDGRLQAGGTIEADSDDKAREMASEMLQGSRFPTIEVWRATKVIYRMGKDETDRKA